jgi:NADH-quinone oxidoreductase subunit M
MASVYALRLFIRSMHNRVGTRVRSYDISVLDGVVLVPIVAVILFFAFYPQLELQRSERSVKASVASAHAELSRSGAAVAGNRHETARVITVGGGAR